MGIQIIYFTYLEREGVRTYITSDFASCPLLHHGTPQECCRALHICKKVKQMVAWHYKSSYSMIMIMVMMVVVVVAMAEGDQVFFLLRALAICSLLVLAASSRAVE